MLKVKNVSNKVLGFHGEDGSPVVLLPDQTVEISDGMKAVADNLADTGMVTVEQVGKASAEPVETSAEETGTNTKAKKRTSKKAVKG